MHAPWTAGMLAVLVLGGAAAGAEDAWQATEGWFTLHHDVMRTGYTQDSPGAPFHYVWHREYWGEIIAPEAEPIVAEGLVFFGTLKGILHALESDSGQEKWQADLGSPIQHSPAYCGGSVVAATMSLRGEVVALEASSGKLLWRFRPARGGGFAARRRGAKGESPGHRRRARRARVVLTGWRPGVWSRSGSPAQ